MMIHGTKIAKLKLFILPEKRIPAHSAVRIASPKMPKQVKVIQLIKSTECYSKVKYYEIVIDQGDIDLVYCYTIVMI